MAYYPRRIHGVIFPGLYHVGLFPILLEHSLNLPKYRHAVDISAMIFFLLPSLARFPLSANGLGHASFVFEPASMKKLE